VTDSAALLWRPWGARGTAETAASFDWSAGWVFCRPYRGFEGDSGLSPGVPLRSTPGYFRTPLRGEKRSAGSVLHPGRNAVGVCG